MKPTCVGPDAEILTREISHSTSLDTGQARFHKHARRCIKCGSSRVYRSRRRGPVDHVLSWLGAKICRCHDCRLRQAWFGSERHGFAESAARGGSPRRIATARSQVRESWFAPFAVRLGNRKDVHSFWRETAAVGSGLVVWVVAVWWVMARLAATR